MHMAFPTYGAIAITCLAYIAYRFNRRISPDIPYAGEESFLARLRAPAEFNANPIDFLVKQRKRLGDVFCVDLFLIKFVFLLGPEGNRVVFRAPENVLNFNECFIKLLGPFLSELLMDPRYLDFVMKNFHTGFSKPERLREYAQLTEKLTDEFFQNWSSAESVPLFESFSSLIYAFMLVIILGDEFYRKNGDKAIALLREFGECLRSPILRLVPQSLWKFTYTGSHGFHIQKQLNNLFLVSVKEHFERSRKGLNLEDPSYVAYACQNIDEEFISHLGTHMPLLLFSGHANLAQVIPWFFLHARTKQGAIERCRDEIEVASLMDRSATPFVEACLRETGRLYSAGNVMRSVYSRPPNGYVTLMGCRIPAGTNVSCSLAATHRDPSIFEEPETWKPERFLENDGKNYMQWFQRFEFIQFGAGAHSCPGEKLSRLLFFDLILKTWMSKYDIEVVDGLREGVGLDNVGAEAAWMDEPGGTPPMKGDVRVKVTMRAK